jgi:peptidoglycan/LPS O-acetylase OafA/YrhL
MADAARYVPPLTGIRALAALLVLGMHTEQNVPAGLDSLLPFLTRGYLGVDFFFVLSGFIITHVYLASLAQPKASAVRIFFWHRFIRLYPVHVTVLAGLVVVVSLAGAAGLTLNNPQEWQWSELAWQLTLLHAWGVTATPGWNVPSWSISAEWFAYLLFPLLAPALVRLRYGMVALLVAVAALAVAAAVFATAGWTLNTWVGAPALVRVLAEFVCGAALRRAIAPDRGPARPKRDDFSSSHHPAPSFCFARDLLRKPAPAFRDHARGGDVLGAAAFIAFLLGASAGLGDFALVALLAATVLGAATSTGSLAHALGSRPLVWLGEISYSIYMVHFPVLIVIRRLWERLGFTDWPVAGKMLAFMATIALVIALAAVLFYLVERPARSRLRDRMGRLAAA